MPLLPVISGGFKKGWFPKIDLGFPKIDLDGLACPDGSAGGSVAVGGKICQGFGKSSFLVGKKSTLGYKSITNFSGSLYGSPSFVAV